MVIVLAVKENLLLGCASIPSLEDVLSLVNMENMLSLFMSSAKVWLHFRNYSNAGDEKENKAL